MHVMETSYGGTMPPRSPDRGDRRMRYNPKARLDRSQVENRRGSGGGGGGGFPIGGGGGGGLKVGGGIGGLVLLVIIFLVQSQLGGGSGAGPGDQGAGQGTGQGSTSLDQCRNGTDANQDPDCALLAD